MLVLLLWLILFILAWPLALLVLLVYPLIWLVLLPFRILGFAVSGVFDVLRTIISLPFKALARLRR